MPRFHSELEKALEEYIKAKTVPAQIQASMLRITVGIITGVSVMVAIAIIMHYAR